MIGPGGKDVPGIKLPNGVTVIKDPFLPGYTIIVSPLMFNLLKVGCEGKGSTEKKEDKN